jgi:hypothetical protein
VKSPDYDSYYLSLSRLSLLVAGSKKIGESGSGGNLMSMGKKIAWVTIIVVGMLWIADEYPSFRFRGDGKFSGGPVLGYSIRMHKIPFYTPGEYAFRFRGVPSKEMNLLLYAEGKSFSNEAEITRIATNIEASLADQTGRVVCEASGAPLTGAGKRDDSNPKGWVTMLSPDEAAYWNGNCLRMLLKPSDSYTLTVRIQNIDPNAPAIYLIPTLEGGQPDMI